MDFSFEILHPIYDSLNDEVDVLVKLHSNQEEYHVTFVTYQRAQEIFEKQSFSLFSTTLFLEVLNEEQIEKVLQQVIEKHSASSFFYPINEQARIALFRKLNRERKLNS